MALVNDVKKEIHAKLVYFGPAQAGKTTNLEFIYSKLKPEYRGKFKFMNTSSGRIVFFDFMRPELAGIKDYSIRFHIYTVPGEVVDVAIWKNVLKGADGVVFVADLDPLRMLENRRSLESLKDILAGYGTAPGETPCLFQCNKKDVTDSSSMEQIKSLLETDDFRMVPASARSGEGVLPTLSEMVKMVLQKLRDLPIAAEEEEPVVPVEPETSAIEPIEEIAAPAAEPEAGPVVESVEPIEAASVSVEPLLESVSPEPFAERFEELVEEEITPEVDVETPAEMVPEAAELSGGMTAEAYHPVEESCAPENSEPEIEVVGDMVALGAGRFRLPLVIRLGEREVKTTLSLDISFEKPGLS